MLKILSVVFTKITVNLNMYLQVYPNRPPLGKEGEGWGGGGIQEAFMKYIKLIDIKM
jgi:hypothetical protein